METGFLNPIHDEEHFSSSFYNQGSELDDSEHMLFGEMIVPEVIDYDNLWHDDDMGGPSQAEEPGTRKEDFQRMLFEWQNQLTSMQEPEVIEKIVPVAEKTSQVVSDMFASVVTSASTTGPTAPSIDELFPLETNKDAYAETVENIRENDYSKVNVKEEANENLEQNLDETTVKPEPGNIETFVVEREDGEPPLLVDIETVNEDDEVPLLMAKDLTSLLEQFEATEKVNSLQPTSTSPPRLSNQTIRDALPAEVISRIKATRENHKKMISVIPAMPNKRSGKAATRMQDAGATLSRNKLLKLVTGGSGGESVQLDHDYCTSGDSGSSSSRGFYVSDSSEYPSQASTPDTTMSRMPEFYTTSNQRVRRVDTGSRKDSGLESGENSEEEITQVKEVKNEVVPKSVSGMVTEVIKLNVVTENGVVIGSAPVRRNVPMVSVLKKNNLKVENSVKPSAINCESSTPKVASASVQSSMDKLETKKKKKLNLEEYRVRREEREKIRSQESSRANSPVPCSTPPAQPDSTTTSQEGVPKEKPVMLSVEVQTQTCDFVDLTSSKPSKDQEKSRKDRKEKRNDLKHRSYRSHHSSCSSSSSSDSDRHRSHKRRRRSRSNMRQKSSASRMWSRSPSHSSSRSQSSSSRSRSRSRDHRRKWRSRSPRRSSGRHSNSRSSYHARESRDRERDRERERSWQRARSPVRPVVRVPEFGTQEKVRQVEERRVIYVGRIDEGTTKADLRKRFQQFGPIVDISVHFRERGDNYGFVTFGYKADAYKAVEHGNDDPKQPRYDLCFGGRRAFCKQRYADLDGLATTVYNQYGAPIPQPPQQNDSFDLLLHEMKAQLRKRSSV